MALLVQLSPFPGAGRRGWLRRLRPAACAFVLALTLSASAASVISTEYDIKAVFLLNFTRFVEWPTPVPPDKSLVIGVLGKDPFGDRLDEAVRGEKAANRSLEVRRIQRIEEAEDCDMIFICRSEKPVLGKILNWLNGRSILTVSDIPDFAETGGMVGLVTGAEKIQLHINLDASKKAPNLLISAKLLRLAEIVSTRKASQFVPHDGSEFLARKVSFRMTDES